MTRVSKPILHNGFQLSDGLVVRDRIETVFFTEVYLLSDGNYLYLFTNMKPDQIMGEHKVHGTMKVRTNQNEYLGVVAKNHSHAAVTKVIEDLTTLRGFDCVAGMQELKKLLVNDVIKPLAQPERFQKFKLSIPNGILLFGPPGCGKTFIVRKLAEELGYTYIEARYSDMMSSYMHGTVKKVAKIFDEAKKQVPSILFIDEIEGLVPKRDGLHNSMEYKKEEVNEFLTQLNDAGEKGILVVGATNRPHLIDTAVLRSGRMDKRILVPPPDFEARVELFKMYLSGRPHTEDIDYKNLSARTKDFACSDIKLLVDQVARRAVHEDRTGIDEEMIVAMIDEFTPSISPEELADYYELKDLERW